MLLHTWPFIPFFKCVCVETCGLRCDEGQCVPIKYHLRGAHLKGDLAPFLSPYVFVGLSTILTGGTEHNKLI